MRHMTKKSTKATTDAALGNNPFAEDVTKGFEDLVANGRKNLQSAFKSSADAAEEAFVAGSKTFTENYAKAVQSGKEQAEKAVGSFKDMPLYDKEGSEAFIAAGTTAATKGEKLGEELLANGNAYATEFFAMSRSLADAEDVPEAVKIQTEYARNSYEKFVADFGKLSSMGLEVTRAVAEPLNSRYSVSIDKMMKQVQI